MFDSDEGPAVERKCCNCGRDAREGEQQAWDARHSEHSVFPVALEDLELAHCKFSLLLVVVFSAQPSPASPFLRAALTCRLLLGL